MELSYTNHDGEWLSPSRMVKLDRFQCTKDNPWSKSKSLWANHPDAEEGFITTGDIGMISGKDYKGYKCPWCLHHWDEVWN